MEQEDIANSGLQLAAMYGLATVLHNVCVASNFTKTIGGTAEQSFDLGAWHYEPRLGNWQGWRWQPAGWQLRLKLFGTGSFLIRSQQKRLVYWSCTSGMAPNPYYTMSDRGMRHERGYTDISGFGGPLPTTTFDTLWLRVSESCHWFAQHNKLPLAGMSAHILKPM